MGTEANINWYPGHMKRTSRLIEENLGLVDAVAELRDARIPDSSRNPDIASLTAGKPRVVVLNKADMARPSATAAWISRLREEGVPAVAMDCRTGAGADRFAPAVREALADLIAYRKERGQAGRPLRLMVLGIPNVGKSSFINRLAGRKAASAEDRPGVTRGKQWISVQQGMQLLDTPGILWPKFESENVGLALAWVGSINDDILDIEMVASKLLERLSATDPDALAARYRIEASGAVPGYELLEKLGRKRGFLSRGGGVDTERAARVLLDEFREGKLGKITLEMP